MKVRIYLNTCHDTHYEEVIECAEDISDEELNNVVEEYVSNFISYGWEKL